MSEALNHGPVELLAPLVRLRRILSSLILPARPASGFRIWGGTVQGRWRFYLATVGIVALITALGLSIEQRVATMNLAMLYLLAVVVSALRWGIGQAIVCALSGAIAFDFFFIPPYRTFAVRDVWYSITTTTLLGAGLVIGALASEAREQTNRARMRESLTSALYVFSQSLIGANRLEQIVEAAGRHIVEMFRCYAVVLLPRDGKLTVYFSSAEYHFDGEEKKAATWVFGHAEKAGSGTESFPGMKGRYLPLKTAWGVKGVLGLQPDDSTEWLAPEKEQVLDLLAGQAALAIERAVVEEQARDARLLQETDRLQKTLLNTVSHNLRTPLASVTGTLGTLLEDIAVLDDSTRNELLENAYDQALHLNRLVGNLLDMTRLEAGAIRLKTEPSDVQDVAGAALAQLGSLAARRKILTTIPEGLPMVPMDFVLVAQVLVNLLDNALKYSPPIKGVEIQARLGAGFLEVLVSDRGPGIAPACLERVFEKFNRGGRAGEAGGFGLGLSICKGFVEAHGGRIWAANRADGGTVITFTLPLKGPPASREPSDERARSTNPPGR